MELAAEPAPRQALTSVLVLNASYEVLSVTRWQRAVCMIISGKAEVVEESVSTIHSASLDLRLPSVIRMVYYIKLPRLCVPFSRSNVFMRDHHICQYCGKKSPASNLTLDHVIPRAEGGACCWENMVTACRWCNAKKGDKTPEAAGMALIRKPKAPFYFPSLHMHFRQEWGKYIPFAIPKPSKLKH